MASYTIEVRSDVDDTRDVVIAQAKEMAELLDYNGGEKWEVAVFDNDDNQRCIDEYVSAEGAPNGS